LQDADQWFAKAAERLGARDAEGAEALLRQGLALRPDHAPALRQLALIVGRAGRDGECVALLERALAHPDPDEAAAFGVLLAAAHQRAGRPGAAETAYRRVLARSPCATEALLRLGLLLGEQGRDGEAAEVLRAAAAAEPGLAAAHSALAAALRATGDLAGAAASAERALAIAPNDAALARNLAVIRNAQGRFEEAAALCREAVAAGEDATLLNTLGVALKEAGQLDAAAASFERAAALRPGFIEALYNLAAARKDQGRTDTAIALLREVVRFAPDLAAARIALCMAHLAPLYADEAEIARRRAEYAAELDALAAHAGRAGAGALAPGVGAAQPFYLAYQGRNDRELQQRYGALVCHAMAEAFPAAPLAAPPAPGEPIRVGVVCGHIRRHPVWRIPTRGWVAGLDRARFELVGYHTSALCDPETEQAEGLFDRFVQGPLPLAVWRERIAMDRPHVLIYPEIGMDPTVAQLAAMRLAPVQYASWGHPSTSGYPTIDGFLSSEAMEPPDGEDHYTEELVRLPGLSTPVALEPLTRPVPSRAGLGLPPEATVYWCGQSLYKYLPQHDDLFAAIAARTPGGRFVFIEFPGSPELTRRFQARLASAFADRGLSAERACVFLPRMSADEHLAAIGCADVVLDSIGWSGCNSLLDALVHALPIVTLPGETMRARHGAAILRAIGLDQLIAPTKPAYVDLAVALASPGARAAVSRMMRQGLSHLNDAAPVAELERRLIAAVHRPLRPG
jgi:predicted O-linked N-acetylglucosamine transferase (SPINDLY family)